MHFRTSTATRTYLSGLRRTKARLAAMFAEMPILFFAVVIGVALTFRVAIGWARGTTDDPTVARPSHEVVPAPTTAITFAPDPAVSAKPTPTAPTAATATAAATITATPQPVRPPRARPRRAPRTTPR